MRPSLVFLGPLIYEDRVPHCVSMTVQWNLGLCRNDGNGNEWPRSTLPILLLIIVFTANREVIHLLTFHKENDFLFYDRKGHLMNNY
jgi:hypothetical protein